MKKNSALLKMIFDYFVIADAEKYHPGDCNPGRPQWGYAIIAKAQKADIKNELIILRAP
jgi:hypothetical protein